MPQSNEEERKKNNSVSRETVTNSDSTHSHQGNDDSQQRNDAKKNMFSDFEDTSREIDALLNNEPKKTNDSSSVEQHSDKHIKNNLKEEQHFSNEQSITEPPRFAWQQDSSSNEKEIKAGESADHQRIKKPSDDQKKGFEKDDDSFTKTPSSADVSDDEFKPQVTISDPSQNQNDQHTVSQIKQTLKNTDHPKEELFEIHQTPDSSKNTSYQKKRNGFQTKKKIQKKKKESKKKSSFSFPKIRLNFSSKKDNGKVKQNKKKGLFSGKKSSQQSVKTTIGQQNGVVPQSKSSQQPEKKQGQKRTKNFSLFSKGKSTQGKKGFFDKKKKTTNKLKTTNQIPPQTNQQDTFDSPVQQQQDSAVQSDETFVQQTMDEDIKKVLLMTDELLAKLPDDVIEDFASSDDFALYQKVMNKYNIK